MNSFLFLDTHIWVGLLSLLIGHWLGFKRGRRHELMHGILSHKPDSVFAADLQVPEPSREIVVRPET